VNPKTVAAVFAATAVGVTLLVGTLFSPAGRAPERRVVEPYGLAAETLVVVVLAAVVLAVAAAVVRERWR